MSQVCEELIPEAARRKLATAVDIFVEKDAWQVIEAERLLHCAKQHGLAIKLHSDQFHCIGGTELGIHLGALSVDHLEASEPEQITKIAASSTIATILPGVSLHLGIPAAPGRKLIDTGAAVAVGTRIDVDHRRTGAKERLPSGGVRRRQCQDPGRNCSGIGNQPRRERDA